MSEIKTKNNILILIVLFICGMTAGYLLSGMAGSSKGTHDLTDIEKPKTTSHSSNEKLIKSPQPSPFSEDKAFSGSPINETGYLIPSPPNYFRIHKEEDQKRMVQQAAYTDFYKELVEVLDIKKGQTAADIGSGHGWSAFILSQAVGHDGIVYSTDINDSKLRYQLNVAQDMIKKFGDKVDYLENLRFRKNEIDNLLLPDNSLDWAIMSGVHIFCYDPEAPGGKKPRNNPDEIIKSIHQIHGDFARSLAKSIKPDGRLVIIEGFPCSNLALNEKQIEEVMSTYGFYPDTEYADKKNALKSNIMLVFRIKK